jgi:hypothetical protein
MEIDSPSSIGISTGFGIPTGGTAGQMLIKNSSTNYDTLWGNLSYGTVTLGGTWPTSNNTDITISSVSGTGLSVASNIITLQNGGVYYISANCSIPSSNFAEYVWTNTSNALLSGVSVGWSPSPSGIQTASPSTAAGIISLSAGAQIKLRTSIVNGVTAAESPYYYNIQIIQLR